MKRFTVLAVLLTILGCGHEDRTASPAPNSAAELRAAEGSSTAANAAASASPRMIIRTALLSLVVDDAADSLRAAIAVVERYGGYVGETRQWRDNGRVRASATLRVPAEKLFQALPEIRQRAIRVESESVTGEDVSEAFSDLSAQLTNLQATEVELRELLSTVRQRTQKASDVLEVYDKLASVRADIDRIQGKMTFLKQQTAMSTIKLELVPDALSRPIVEPGWRPLTIAKTAARELVNALKGVATVVIWIFVFLVPFALALAIVVLSVRLVWKLIRRWRGR